MKKKALVGVLLLVAVCGVRAQEASVMAGSRNAAGGFSGTSAAQVKLFNVSTDPNAEASAAPSDAKETSAEPAAALPAAPAAKPKILFGERDDYRWQLGVGFEYLHFNSSQFDANLLGLNTSLTYFTNSWFGLEGDVITGFSTETFNTAHAKIFSGMGGLRLGSRRAKWEPWMHGLAGGSHLQPQTAGGGRTSLMAVAGGGVDYRIHARLSFRVEGDWVYTQYYNQTQNNFQGIGGVVLHF